MAESIFENYSYDSFAAQQRTTTTKTMSSSESEKHK